MTRVAISHLEAHLSEHLRRVEQGADIEVVDRARPIARIVPLSSRIASQDGRGSRAPRRAS
jgi:prevent-host-death family protein